MKKSVHSNSRPILFKDPFFSIGGICLLALSIALIYLAREDAPEQVAAPVAPSVAPEPASTVPPRGLVWLADPLANSTPAAQPPAYIIRREKKLRALMLSSPPHYFTMTLGELTKLAKLGDGNAMQQLAEQYLSEADRLRRDPDYPVGADTRELATQYLKDSLMAGRIRNAAVLSKQLFDENKLVEAYAWRLVSQKLDDGVNPVWGRDTNQFGSLTDNEKSQASLKADELYGAFYMNLLRTSAPSRDGAH
jgi:hypothetical protein